MLGIIAGIFTTCAFIPQVVRVVQTKETKSISLLMYCISVTGLCLWIIHGLVVKDISVSIANFLTLILSAIILIYKVKYK
ncbi:MAG: SemiSWEET transporter [Clostridiales bacterium]|nr:SemiSWEET transporter [Clostridiales bacterium]